MRLHENRSSFEVENYSIQRSKQSPAVKHTLYQWALLRYADDVINNDVIGEFFDGLP